MPKKNFVKAKRLVVRVENVVEAQEVLRDWKGINGFVSANLVVRSMHKRKQHDKKPLALEGLFQCQGNDSDQYSMVDVVYLNV